MFRAEAVAVTAGDKIEGLPSGHPDGACLRIAAACHAVAPGRLEGTVARRERVFIAAAAQAIPAKPITHVDGSGTATGLARRKPVSANPSDASPVTLPEDDKLAAGLFQAPPRSPRVEPVLPSRSFH